MTIQDAIKQAGEGGKIKRANWSADVTISMNRDGMYDNFRKQRYMPCAVDILSTDWEVVAPDIEVGDVVFINSYPSEREIVSIEDDTVKHRDAELVTCGLTGNKFTIIRKGAKKHVFEDVSWHKECQQAVPFSGNDMGIALATMCSNGKIYTMTLEEND